MKKILALLLILTSLFCLVACGGGGGEDGAPEGMMLASDPEKDGYRFYIPQSYLYARVAGGVLSYVSNVDKSSISIMRVAYDGSIEEYFEAHADEFEKLYKSYKFKEKTDKPYPAFEKRYRYDVTYVRQNKDGSTADEHYGVVQLFSKQGGYLYILTYEASCDQNEIIGAIPYEENYESFVSVAKSFVFTEKAKTGGTAAIPNFTFDNGDTPEGMRLASDPALCNYRLYLPKDWKFDVQTNLTSGYVSDTDTDRSNVSMYGVIYEEKTYAEYFKNVKAELKSVYGDYTLTEKKLSEVLGDNVTSIGGESEPYVYLIEGKTPSGQSVKVLRIAIVKGYYVFTLQYTALTENFDAHLDEVASIVSAFRFKGQK